MEVFMLLHFLGHDYTSVSRSNDDALRVLAEKTDGATKEIDHTQITNETDRRDKIEHEMVFESIIGSHIDSYQQETRNNQDVSSFSMESYFL